MTEKENRAGEERQEEAAAAAAERGFAQSRSRKAIRKFLFCPRGRGKEKNNFFLCIFVS